VFGNLELIVLSDVGNSKIDTALPSFFFALWRAADP
jgi:hypothetical protein